MRRMLIVDDDEEIVGFMTAYFASCSFEVDSAQDVDEAKRMLATRRYAILLTDLSLTGSWGREGLELARFVRLECPCTRVVVMTAYGTAEVEAEARVLGVGSFVYKPTPLEELRNVVARVLEQVEN